MAKNGLDKWFKQKWVDIGSKRKGWFFRKVWPFQTKEGRQTKVSQVCPTCESKIECQKAKENLPLQGNGQCQCGTKTN